MRGKGFAAATPEQRREWGAKGGRSTVERGTGYRFKEGDEATIEAARKGGKVSRGGRVAVLGRKQ